MASRPRRRLRPNTPADAYAAHRDQVGRHQARLSASGRDIGPLPPVVNPERREACRLDLALFLSTYMPAAFFKPWSDDHRRVIAKLQYAILKGGLFVEAVYRAFGKTSIAEGTAIWAVLHGHRRFVPIIGADQPAAADNIDSIQGELEENDLLAEDFPEVCYPVRALEGIAQRCQGQTFEGRPTHIEWRAETLVLPLIPGSPSGGSIITSRGITGRVRGMKHKRRDGVQLRPDFILIDDPQTDESAASATQVDKRLEILQKAILQSGGHMRRIAGVVCGTVIQPGDFMDRLLDPEQSPAWQSERIPLVRRFADAHDKMWLGEYARLRRTYNRDDPNDQGRARAAATAYYAENRKAMDAGCRVSWADGFDETEISAVQHAYNALVDFGETMFASEYQNQPLRPGDHDEEFLDAAGIAAKTNGYARGVVPKRAQILTAFVDLHDKLLYWMVAAWQENFTGYVVDYGAYPDQRRPYFAARDVTHTLGRVYQGGGKEEALRLGIEKLSRDLMDRAWPREEGGVHRIDRLLIDRAWKPDVAEAAWRRLGGVSMLSHGMGIGPDKKPMSEYRRKPGERIGHFWWMPSVKGTHQGRHVRPDTNYWKTFIHLRLATGASDPGSLTLFGTVASTHRLLADHLTAEGRVKTRGRDRAVDVWTERKKGADNHWLDCLVGCAVGASMGGAALRGMTERALHLGPRRKWSQADLRRRRQKQ